MGIVLSSTKGLTSKGKIPKVSSNNEKHLAQVLATEQDEYILSEVFKEKDWVLQMN